MNSKNTQYRIRRCSMCPEETNYLCSSCTFDMCSKCRQKHWFNLLTIDHDVVTYREKINYIHRREVCAQHRNKHYRKYCEACNLLKSWIWHKTATTQRRHSHTSNKKQRLFLQTWSPLWYQSRYKKLSKGVFFISIRSVN